MNAFPMGALTNFHTFLHSVSPTSHTYDDSLLDRNNMDAGIGASSYFQRIFTATRDVSAGEELFSNYGENWLDSHHFNDVPRKKNFRRAHRILQLLAENNIMDSNYIDTLATVVSWYDKRTASLLPRAKNGGEVENEISVNIDDLAESTINKRSVEWIKENGKCLDNIYADTSTIPQAGKGAFASRFIGEGQLIMPMPLLQIANKTNSTMFDTKVNEKGEKERDSNKDIGNHLLMNYCFDHPDSSLLLCASTHGALINHDSNNPNSMYKWADWDPNTKNWLNMSYEQISQRRDKGLTFDIIALRDIQPNEEITIDYGPRWEEAWRKHLSTFKPVLDGTFQSTYKMNQEMVAIRAIEELRSNPYASNVMTACKYYEEAQNEVKLPFLSDYNDDDVFWNELHLHQDRNSSSKTIQDFLDTYEHLSTSEYSSLKDVPEKDLEYWPCKPILRTNDDPELYTVQINQSPASSNTRWTNDDLFRFVTDFPRDKITFLTKPYMSDLFLDGVFRHSIGMRDDLVPDAWRNLK